MFAVTLLAACASETATGSFETAYKISFDIEKDRLNSKDMDYLDFAEKYDGRESS